MRTISILAGVLAVVAMGGTSQRTQWNRPHEPFRIMGNLYYVGAAGVSAFLITTPEGSILLEGGLPETAPEIERNVAKLGFRMRDVKYLLNSHAHYDHCGGLAELKRASGAAMVASQAEIATLASGIQLSYGSGQSETRFPAVQVDRIVRDKDTISLGGVTLTAHITPGHTKGCTTWTTTVPDGTKTDHVVFYCSTTVAGNQLVNNAKYPKILEDYAHSFEVLRNLPCDIFLGPHPEFFDMDGKLAKLKAGNKEAFVDSGELKRFVAQSEQDFKEELAKQKGSHL